MPEERVLFRFVAQDAASRRIKELTGHVTKLQEQLRKTSVAAKQADVLSRKVATLETRLSSSAKAASSASRHTVDFASSVRRASNVMGDFGATVRQIGQGLQNFGTTMSLFVTAPISLAVANTTKTILDLDDALVEARKNAGLTVDQIGELREGLLDLSRLSPTDVGDLGKIAADAGRLGIKSVPEILAFTKVIDQLQVATTLTAEEAGTQIGRLVNIFSKELQDGETTFEEFVTGLGSAINELGQNIAGNESEIVSAALRIAPAASAIGMSATDVLGLAASIVEVSASAERGGTQVNTALNKMAEKVEDITSAAGVSIDNFAEQIRENPTEAFLSLVDAVSRIDDPVARTQAAIELFGRTGAKSVNALGASFSSLTENIALSRRSFDEATSLQQEFNRALESTRNQLRVVRNNLIVVGTTIGDVLLPSVTEFLSVAVPAIQRVSQEFKAMTPELRRNIALLIAFAASIGPISFLLGSLGFVIGIVTTGLQSGVVFLSELIQGFIWLGSIALSVFSPLGLAIVGVGAAIVLLLKDVESVQKIVSSLGDLARSSFSWGYNLIAAFADGIASAAGAVVNAINSVINAFLGYIQAFSPPRKGPLRNVTKWGVSTAQAWLDGFAKVSTTPVLRFAGLIGSSLEGALRSLGPSGFDIFGGIVGQVRSAMAALGAALGHTKDEIAASTLDAVESLALLIDAAEEGGVALDSLFADLSSRLGQFGSDFERLLKLQLDYNAANEDLIRIREELSNLDKELDKEIDAIAKRKDLSAEERAALIRNAKLKSIARKKDLEEEEKATESRVDAIKEEIAAQKQLIDALIEALRARGVNVGPGGGSTPRPPGSPGAIPGVSPISLPDLENIGEKIEDVTSKITSGFEEAKDSADSFVGKIIEAKGVVDGFFAGLTGRDLSEFEEPGERFTKGFEKGASVRQRILVWLWFVGTFKSKMEAVGTALSDGFTTAKEKLDELGLVPYISGQVKAAAQAFVDNFGENSVFSRSADNAKTVLGGIIENLGKIGFAAIMALFGGLPAFAGFMGSLAGILSNVLGSLLGIAGVLTTFASIVIFGGDENDLEKLEDSLALINPKLQVFAPWIFAAAAGLRRFVEDGLEKLQNMDFSFFDDLRSKIQPFTDAVSDLVGALDDIFAVLVSSDEGEPSKLDRIIGILSEANPSLGEFASNTADFVESVQDIYNAIKNKLESIDWGGISHNIAMFVVGVGGVAAIIGLLAGVNPLLILLGVGIGLFGLNIAMANNPLDRFVDLIDQFRNAFALGLGMSPEELSDFAASLKDFALSLFLLAAGLVLLVGTPLKEFGEAIGVVGEQDTPFDALVQLFALFAGISFGTIANGLSTFMDPFSAFVAELQVFAGLATGDFGMAVDGLDRLVGVVDRIKERGALKTLSGMFAILGVVNPVFLVVAAILYGISNALDSLGNAIANSGETIKDFFGAVKEKLSGIGGDLGDRFSENLEENIKFGPGVLGIGGAVGKAIVETIIEVIADGLSNVGDWFEETFSGFIKWWKRGKMIFVAIAKLVIAFLMGKLSEEILGDSNAFGSIVSSFFTWWSTSWVLVKAAGKLVGAAIMSAITGSIESAKNAFDKITSNLRDWLSRQIEGAGGLWDAAKDVGTKIVRGIKSGIADAWNDLVGFLRSKIESLDVFGWLKGKFGGGGSNGGNSVSGQSFGGGFGSPLPSVKLPDFSTGLVGAGASGSVYNISVNINGANIDKTTARSIAEEIGRELDRIQRRRM